MKVKGTPVWLRFFLKSFVVLKTAYIGLKAHLLKSQNDLAVVSIEKYSNGWGWVGLFPTHTPSLFCRSRTTYARCTYLLEDQKLNSIF